MDFVLKKIYMFAKNLNKKNISNKNSISSNKIDFQKYIYYNEIIAILSTSFYFLFLKIIFILISAEIP